MPSVSPAAVRHALPQEWSQIESMVRLGFGDDEPFLRAYFDHIWQKYPTLVSTQDDQPAAMTILLPCRSLPQDVFMIQMLQKWNINGVIRIPITKAGFAAAVFCCRTVVFRVCTESNIYVEARTPIWYNLLKQG